RQVRDGATELLGHGLRELLLALPDLARWRRARGGEIQDTERFPLSGQRYAERGHGQGTRQMVAAHAVAGVVHGVRAPASQGPAVLGLEESPLGGGESAPGRPRLHEVA